MATITTDTFLDGGTARTAGEAWTCNGGRLIIRTDSRWHANAPASMTGSLGAVTISATLGGGYTIDGTKVRWMPITGGSGTCAIGTTISQGGVSGYFLGYWASLTSAPSTTIRATGFIKLREVTGGTFAAGALSGITATASGPDVVGWIEVVHDQSIAITVPRLGDFTVRGDWFVLGTTTGVANQLVQCPTNGSTTSYVPGVYIETAVAGEYEFVPSLYAGGMNSTNLGTDARSKFVCMETNGAIRIGTNGTEAIGYVWPAGRKIRIPNVIGRQCTTAARATNAIPSATAATRPDFTTTSAGYIDIENFMSDWYLLFAQPYYVKLKNTATFDYINISECATAFEVTNGGSGISQSLDARTVTLISNFAGGTITDWTCHRYAAGTTDHAFVVLYCIGQTYTRVKSGIVTFARSTGVAFLITQSSNQTFNNCYQFNQGMNFTTCFDCTVNDHDHCDRYMGATTTTGVYAFVVASSCENIVIDGVTFGLGGTVANCHPYTAVFNVSLSKNCKFRNMGTRSAFASGGSANNPANIFVSGGNNQNLKFQRLYLAPLRTGTITTVNSDTGNVYEHVYGDGADAIVTAVLNGHIKNCNGTTSVTGQASVYGTHFWDAFVSDTVGRITLPMNEPTSLTAAYVTTVAGTPKFTSAGQLVMASLNDEIIFEMDYFCLGVVSFTNTAPVVTGTNVTYVSGPDWGNHDIYFQYDIGSGWNGSWLDLTAANLVAVGAINPAIGVKLKYRIVCDTASTTNALTYIRVQTDSTLAAQSDNLYPLDTATTTIQANIPLTGAEVRVYDKDNVPVGSMGTEIAGTESSGATFAFSTTGNNTVAIQIMKDGYKEFTYEYTTGTTDALLPVTLQADLNT